MSDLEKAKRALINAHNAGDVEAARKLAAYIKETKQKDDTPAPAFISRGVSTVLGAPADIVSAGMKKAKIAPESFEPVIGRRGIEKGLNKLSESLTGKRMTPLPDEQAETVLERGFEGLGGAGGFLVPGGLLASSLSKGTGMTANIASSIMQGMTKKPASAVAGELAAGAGAGAGAGVASNLFPESGSAEFLGSVVGAATPSGAASTITKGPTAMAGRAAKKYLYEPFTSSRGKMRAEDRLQSTVPDPQEALAALGEEYISPLSPAQKIGEKELLELEAAVADKDPSLRKAREDELISSRQQLQQSIKSEGEPLAARQSIEERKESILNNVTSKRDAALQQAQAKIQSLEPQQRGSQAALILRDELENSYRAAKAQENQLWDSVPAVGIPTQTLKSNFQKMILNTPKAYQDDIPQIAREFLGKGGSFRPAENVKEFQALRSKLLEESREARAAGRYNKARLSDQLADEVLKEMGAKSGSVTGPAGEALKDALEYSRQVAETYRQGAVGRILAPDRLGADKIAPELTLQSIIGAGRIKGDVGAQQILRAASTPEASQAIETYMLGRLNDVAVRDGALNVFQAEKFLKQNEDILDKFPKVREQLTDAVKFQKESDRLTGRLQSLEKSFVNSQKSNAAKFLNANIDKEIDAIMRSKNPQEAARQISAMVRNDENASRGLKAAASDYVFNKAKTNKFDDYGNEILDANKLISILNDNRQRQGLRQILGDDGIDRLQRIANELQKVQKAERVTSSEKIIGDNTNLIFNTVARIQGAAFGRSLGTGTIQTPQIMSERAKDLANLLVKDKAEQLLINAVYDEELFKILMSGKTRPKMSEKEYFTKLNAWMYNSGYNAFNEDSQEEQ